MGEAWSSDQRIRPGRLRAPGALCWWKLVASLEGEDGGVEDFTSDGDKRGLGSPTMKAIHCSTRHQTEKGENACMCVGAHVCARVCVVCGSIQGDRPSAC